MVKLGRTQTMVFLMMKLHDLNLLIDYLQMQYYGCTHLKNNMLYNSVVNVNVDNNNNNTNRKA